MQTTHTLLKYCIAAVWLINGFFCKPLNLVPRHQQIVARILGGSYAALLTTAIGIAETLMAIWILSGVWPRVNVVMQIIIIAVMNIIEVALARDLLLWGGFNAIFAFAFIVVIYVNQFYLSKKIPVQA